MLGIGVEEYCYVAQDMNHEMRTMCFTIFTWRLSLSSYSLHASHFLVVVEGGTPGIVLFRNNIMWQFKPLPHCDSDCTV